MLGIFDSGSGGLSVLAAIVRIFPQADIVYFGDLAHMPYGARTHNDLVQLTRRGLDILHQHHAHHIVSACNSVSTQVVLPDTASFPDTTEMLMPTVLSLAHEEHPLVLLATPATVTSGMYEQAFHAHGKQITSIAIPDLAPAIEHGMDTSVIHDILSSSLPPSSIPLNAVIILGCTHYPLAMASIASWFAMQDLHVTLLDPADAVAHAIPPLSSGKGIIRFLLSAPSEVFESRARALFPHNTLTCTVISADIAE